MTSGDFIGVNWGSTNFRAYRISPNGVIWDERTASAGVATLDRAGMERTLNEAVAGWEDCTDCYATGMIGSDIGWTAVPYMECPAGLKAIASALTRTRIGAIDIGIVPGLACIRNDGSPDILRGEEMELYGALALGRTQVPPRHVVLPGTHTKWIVTRDAVVSEFMTAMSGEIFDRMTSAGLLASVVTSPAEAGDAFTAGVDAGLRAEPGLAVALFGIRARVIRGMMPPDQSASYLRGLLIGLEIADARRLYPDLGVTPIPLIGNTALAKLYQAALSQAGCDSHVIDARMACVTGLSILHGMLA